MLRIVASKKTHQDICDYKFLRRAICEYAEQHGIITSFLFGFKRRLVEVKRVCTINIQRFPYLNWHVFNTSIFCQINYQGEVGQTSAASHIAFAWEHSGYINIPNPAYFINHNDSGLLIITPYPKEPHKIEITIILCDNGETFGTEIIDKLKVRVARVPLPKPREEPTKELVPTGP